MPQRFLKPLRVVVSLAFLLAVTAPFVDVQEALPPGLADPVLDLQFVPSLVRFLGEVGGEPGWAAAGFLLVLAATLLAGRVYCSSVCPLGTLQDLVSWTAGRARRQSKSVRFRYSKPKNLLRFGILVLTLGSALAGSLALVALLDPFGIFGRAAALLARPAAAAGNNLAGLGLESQGLYVLPPVRWGWAAPAVLALTLGSLAVPLVLALRRGRLFCNTLCPVGALLGLVSRLALLKIRIDSARCTTCANCSLSCKAGCIDLKHKRVDMSRCVACFDCIPVCAEGGIRYGPAWGADRGGGGHARRAGVEVAPPTRGTGVAPRPDPRAGASPGSAIGGSRPRPAPTGRTEPADLAPDAARRLLLVGALAAAGLSAGAGAGRAVRAAPSEPEPDPSQGLAAGEPPKNRLPTTVPEARTRAVAPPGTGAAARFNRTCTACYLCVSACPTRVIQPALLAYGVAGVLQPRLDFAVAYCTYECVRCGEVCPTGAIARLAPEAKTRVRAGQVRFIEDNCVVVTDRKDCGACAEHCPTRAVYMVDWAEHPGLALPELDEAVCVGCGACEHACPTRPYRAIYVDGEAVQGVAEPPRRRPQESTAAPVPAAGGGGADGADADFPF